MNKSGMTGNQKNQAVGTSFATKLAFRGAFISLVSVPSSVKMKSLIWVDFRVSAILPPKPAEVSESDVE